VAKFDPTSEIAGEKDLSVTLAVASGFAAVGSREEPCSNDVDTGIENSRGISCLDNDSRGDTDGASVWPVWFEFPLRGERKVGRAARLRRLSA
jgi:hypothetical protein